MPVKAKIRFDYKASSGAKRFFWQRVDLCEAAKDLRAKQLSLLKNLPFQGLAVEEVNVNHDVYMVPNSDNTEETAYAPLELTVEADSLEDLMQLTLREEFRKIKVLEPAALSLSNCEVERLLFRVNEEYRDEFEE